MGRRSQRIAALAGLAALAWAAPAGAACPLRAGERVAASSASVVVAQSDLQGDTVPQRFRACLRSSGRGGDVTRETADGVAYTRARHLLISGRHAAVVLDEFTRSMGGTVYLAILDVRARRHVAARTDMLAGSAFFTSEYRLEPVVLGSRGHAAWILSSASGDRRQLLARVGSRTIVVDDDPGLGDPRLRGRRLTWSRADGERSRVLPPVPLG